MKRNKLINEKWYWIEYKTKKGYKGPAKYIEEYKYQKGLYSFYVPKYSTNFLYALSDIKSECKPAPDYDELLKICGIKLEDYK